LSQRDLTAGDRERRRGGVRCRGGERRRGGESSTTAVGGAFPLDTDFSFPRCFMLSEPLESDLVRPCRGRPFSMPGDLDCGLLRLRSDEESDDENEDGDSDRLSRRILFFSPCPPSSSLSEE
jgi:hypothetical protein